MAVQPVKTPFTKMTFSPDVPSSALAANEYNAGQNVESDVRSVKSVLGDQYILSQITGNPIFVTSGFDVNSVYWFIVATSQGHWYAIDSAGITDVTPLYGTFTGYSTSTTITASWSTNSLTASYLTPVNSYQIANLTASNISASGAIIATSFTGSLFGTSSVATSASNADTASSLVTTNNYGVASLNINTNSPINAGAFRLNIKTNVSRSVNSGSIALQSSDNATIYLNTSWGGANFNPIVQAGDTGIIFLSSSIDQAQGFFIAPWANNIGGFRINNSGSVGIKICRHDV